MNFNGFSLWHWTDNIGNSLDSDGSSCTGNVCKGKNSYIMPVMRKRTVLGDVVKLFLCRSCQGLFILDCQIKKHVKNCNGDAFKSPANLFACEREHFLELIAPVVRSCAADFVSLTSKRKRRKSAPLTNNEAKKQVTGSPLSRRDDDTTRSSASLAAAGTGDLALNTQTNKTMCRSHSQPQISPMTLCPDSVSEAERCRDPDNVLNDGISLDVRISQSFTATSTGVTDPVHCHSQEQTNTTSSIYPSNLKELTFENLTCPDKHIEMVQKIVTPATNLLALLSKLQQGVDSSAPLATDQQEQAVSTISLSHPSGSSSASEDSDHYIVEDHPIDENEPLENFTVQNSTHLLTKVVDNDRNQQEEQVHIMGGEMAEHDDIHFKAVATVSVSKFPVAVGGAGLTGNKMLPISSDSECARVTEHETVISGKRATPYTAEATETSAENGSITSESDCIDEIQYQEGGNQAPDLEKAEEEVEFYQIQSACSSAAHTVTGMTGVGTSAGASPEADCAVQGSVVYILEPDGLQNVTIDESAKANDSFVFAVDVGSGDGTMVSHGDFVVSESLAVDVTSGPSALGSSPLEPVQVYVTASDSFARLESAVKRKSKHRLRLEEQKVLREKVLQQSKEVLPDAGFSKTRYQCNVCGHLAMSIKFMDNHLQVKIITTTLVTIQRR